MCLFVDSDEDYCDMFLFMYVDSDEEGEEEGALLFLPVAPDMEESEEVWPLPLPGAEPVSPVSGGDVILRL